MKIVFVILCCVFVSYDAAKVEAQYLHPKVVEKKITIHSAVILPAKVEITKESAKGQEMMVAESADISNSVMEAVGQTLQNKKIAVASRSVVVCTATPASSVNGSLICPSRK